MTSFADQQKEILSEGLHRPSEMGEMLRFPNALVRADVQKRWGLDHEDFDQRAKNIDAFQRSEEIKRYKVYKKRLF